MYCFDLSPLLALRAGLTPSGFYNGYARSRTDSPAGDTKRNARDRLLYFHCIIRSFGEIGIRTRMRSLRKNEGRY